MGGPHSVRSGPVLQAFAAEGSDVGICSVGSLMLKNALQRLGGPIRQEPHWPPGPSPSVGSRRHSGPSGEWVRNLFTSILRYMRPFFFLFTIIVTLVNPSINRQIRLQRDRMQTGKER